MVPIPAALHRILDFVTIVFFALAPVILGLAGLAAALSYSLSVIHLTMTLLTRFSPSDRAPISLGIHGAVESVVGIALTALPWLMGWHGAARALYVSAGATILLVWALSRYRVAASRATA